MAQHGKQMTVGACKGFSCQSTQLVLLANGNMYDVDSNTFFRVVKPPIHLKYCSVPTMAVFDTFVFVVCVKTHSKTLRSLKKSSFPYVVFPSD